MLIFHALNTTRTSDWPEIELLSATQVAGSVNLKVQLILHESRTEPATAETLPADPLQLGEDKQVAHVVASSPVISTRRARAF